MDKLEIVQDDLKWSMIDYHLLMTHYQNLEKYYQLVFWNMELFLLGQ